MDLARTQNFPGDRLKLICQFGSGTSLPNRDRTEGERVSVILPARCTVHRLRMYVSVQVQNRHPDPSAILDPERYIVLYSKGEDWYEAYDNSQILRTLDMAWWYDDVGFLTAHVVLKEMAEVHCESKQKVHRFLAFLIGHDLEKEVADKHCELAYTRRKLASSRSQELRNRDDTLYTTEPWVANTPVPIDFKPLLNRKLPVTLHYMNQISFSIEVDFSATPDILLKVFQRLMTQEKHEISDTLVLKVTGREEFLSGEYPLKDFHWVRQCLKDNQGLHLTVIPISQLVKETVHFEDLPLVDAFSGSFRSHEELCLEGKAVEDIFMISLWDCNRKLRVKLLGIDIPTFPSKSPRSVYVEAAIIYGNTVLSSVTSSPRLFTDEVLWNEWLDFDLIIKDLPRGAKLGFTINASSSDTSSGTEDSTMSPNKDLKSPASSVSKTVDPQKGKAKVLYFVNLLLINYRSVLSQGYFALHMWFHHDQEDEVITCQADRLSCATNPDISNSMAITFLLDHYTFPVVLPRSFSSTENSDSSNTGISQIKSSPTSVPNTDRYKQVQDKGDEPETSVAVPEGICPNKAPLNRVREKSVCCGPDLPQFLRTVDWTNSRVVEDIHWSVASWDLTELDVTVALELLSMDFADEMVRRLAVQRLESLSNDDVLKYLLQLVQTIKVEPYNDSFLARYLIQRALRSKRIGHFFFWYVRGEVTASPYFRQRMAVVLEAYLLGCGQAMLDGFVQQVQAADALREVAVTIKKVYSDKRDLAPSASLRLQEILKDCPLPNEFLLPLDPRVKVGQILLEKCKVMASKKKPLWLEFSPMASPASASPVGIIFKQGDDLRQDMLVIQTLAVMDSIWQEQSLHLNLVPYGCISTGHNIGMIEIVRDAATIAAVQRSRGGTRGLFRNDALFDWLKSKCSLQEIHFRTVERFVKSCAGYCAATYVLGVGDRHNDNIMITDGGNLFHIDFGHILGNRKHFLGVSRERVPFVLTPDFLYVMGRVKGGDSLYFQCFRNVCTQAYLALRAHSRLLVTLFSLMLHSGMPELSAAGDMRYLREALQEDKSEAEAEAHFLQQIEKCEQLGWTVQANWWIHRMAHR
ncbi:phosphatidylinositol 4,5-bisphosphate 3-kinase catalytic subunit gamma isoform isoform X1 [Phyllopteryx taeniolatus]|uniref:phosphatidylinositol 4,5-bisphosphate 3-kinase catalytic subunit gamma isoform isoform X1 n=1 Tax=Phyllopteryx taeniolatus TaxID=161469 RepID=UPI002AD2EF40|nr:phosphatidylinositol 4,5-bisphosphate 3-kinase catalytic subunit gamma isoform isoform X1 [Phyllopteryx taeniolatus]XP_061621851.1 phosphatidylinositol 4,5-bisphosphate 3-kinase catalytic subunit gamma isoform isoform X1 [Phyllopteryx taeniolatus]